MGRTLRWLRPAIFATACALALPAAATAASGKGKAGTAGASTQSSFGRMFPKLDAFPVLPNQVLADLVQTQRDDGSDEFDNEGVPAGFTYLGQFIDHDLTRDQTPTPTAHINPTTLKNFRTARFDLDSVYLGGPSKNPELYNDEGELLYQSDEDQPNGVRDVQRTASGQAIIGDNRNDENALVVQMHVAVVKFHNRLIEEGHSFAEAQRLTRWHYQWVVVNDYLPHVAGQDRVDRFLRARDLKVRNEYYKPGNTHAPMTPVEFSTAVFRYGHSQVRDTYEINDDFEEEPIPVFRFGPFGAFGPPDPHSLMGGRNIPAGFQIDWSEFFEIDGAQEFEGNLARKFDTKISESLYQLPIPGAEAEGANVLGFRNLNRAQFYGLPSGQDVSRKMGIRPLTNQQIGLSPLFGGGEAPLWYYALAESQVRENGERLGPVAARIVTEVFLTQIDVDKGSYFNAKRRWSPTVEHVGAFTIGDFLNYAGVVEEEDEDEEEEEEDEE
jgi:Animal haem peroxidase